MSNSYKTYRAQQAATKLPRFVNTNSDSDFLKLINIPNIELDAIQRDILATSQNIIPYSLNLSLPTTVHQALVDTGSDISEGEEVNLYDFR